MTVGKMGWIPDLPDIRDYTLQAKQVEFLKLPDDTKVSDAVDLRSGFPRRYHQEISDCTANAAGGIIAYLQKKAYGSYVLPSRLFIYKQGRYLAGITGDEGTYLRSTMGALVLFGAPPEKYWPYDVKEFDKEPDARVYALADNYEALKYVRLDPDGQPWTKTLTEIKRVLTAGWPAMFGFTVYDSISRAEKTGIIPFPDRTDSVAGGHAVVAAGYDDSKKCLLIRNSWGDWGGMDGYLWMPYRYVTEGLTSDWWMMTSQNYVDTGQFGA